MKVDSDDLKDILKLKMMATNDHKFKRYVYNITEDEQIKYGFEFIGTYDYEPNPDSYNINTTYRNTRDRTVYIKTKIGWDIFLKDGENGKAVSMGGGMGFNDVSKLIDERMNSFVTSGGTNGLNASQVQQMIDNNLNTYTPIVNATNIEISGTFINVSGTNLSEVLHSIDNKLNNINYLENYKTIDYTIIEGVPEIMYVGKTNQFNYWYVRKVVTDALGNISQYHANISNNPGILTYADAWNNNLTLAYGNLEDLVFI